MAESGFKSISLCVSNGYILETSLVVQWYRFDPWVGKIPWRREWQPTPVFLMENPHGQRSLVGYSPQGLKELDTAE